MNSTMGRFIYIDLGDDEDVSGVVTKITKEVVYLKDEGVVIGVLKRNIRYFYYDADPESNQAEPLTQPDTFQIHSPASKSIPAPQVQISALEVYVDGEFVTSIPRPSELDLSKWTNKIQDLALQDSKVREELEGKVLKGGDYAPGKFWITTNIAAPPPTEHQGIFALDGDAKDVLTKQLTPDKMIAMLNAAVKKEPKNE